MTPAPALDLTTSLRGDFNPNPNPPPTLKNSGTHIQGAAKGGQHQKNHWQIVLQKDRGYGWWRLVVGGWCDWQCGWWRLVAVNGD